MSTRVDAPIPGSISPTRSTLARRPLLAYFLLAMLTHGASNAATQLLGQVIPMVAPLSGWLKVLVPDWLNVIAFGTAALLLLILTRGRLSYKGEPPQD